MLILKLQSRPILPISADVRRFITPKDACLLEFWRMWQVYALFLQEFVHFLRKKLIELVHLFAGLPERLNRVSVCSV